VNQLRRGGIATAALGVAVAHASRGAQAALTDALRRFLSPWPPRHGQADVRTTASQAVLRSARDCSNVTRSRASFARPPPMATGDPIGRGT
jgi:hypothetical protein